MTINYKNKYLKYKQKYLELVGGKQPDFALNIANVSNENNNSIFHEKRARVRKEKLKSRLTTEEKANHENFIKKLGNNSLWSKILKS